MKPRIVLDTNIVVSAIISEKGAPAQLLRLWQVRQAVEVAASPPLIDELADVLGRPRIQQILALTGRTPEEYISVFRELALVVDAPATGRSFSRDPDDDAIIEAAIAAGADYIISGDRDLLDLAEVEGIPILTVADFLGRLEGAPHAP